MAKKILCFFGTRPEAIKMAPVVARLKQEEGFDARTVVSAQHREMLDQVLAVFGLKSDDDLNVMRENQTLFDITARVLTGFKPVLEREKPDLVLVHGDTTTTLAGALAAFYLRIPVGHVEAGLRTRDMSRPFPEEANRRLADAITTLHFAPTPESAEHLIEESLPKDRIFVTGNTVIDALKQTAAVDRPIKDEQVRKAIGEAASGRLILMTAHRRENFGAPFEAAFNAVEKLSVQHPDVHWIYPVHPNPNVVEPAKRILGGRPNIHLVSPLDYGDLVEVLKRSVLVVTDSGGLQEEAPSLGKPVLVLREVTERPEAVEAGTVRLVGTDPEQISTNVTRLLTQSAAYKKMANAVNPYGDGLACDRIVHAIRWHFGLSKHKPAPFRAGK